MISALRTLHTVVSSTMNHSITCTTSYSGKLYLYQIQINILVIINAMTFLLSFGFNSLVIFTLVTTNQLRKISFKLIFYLSISDGIFEAFTQAMFSILYAWGIQ